jgi:hypothetical protein
MDNDQNGDRCIIMVFKLRRLNTHRGDEKCMKTCVNVLTGRDNLYDSVGMVIILTWFLKI